jgi:hypothetical protein
METRDNPYGVPTRIWQEWTPEARRVFNRTYNFMKLNELDIVVGGYEPVARLASAVAAEAVTNKRMMFGEFYFGEKGTRATQLRRDTRQDKTKNTSTKRREQKTQKRKSPLATNNRIPKWASCKVG